MSDQQHKPDDYFFEWIEMSHDMVILIQDGIIVDINPRVKDLMGYEPAEIIGMNFTEMLPAEHKGLAENYYRRMKGDNVPEVYEAKLPHKDGSFLYVEINASLFNYNGKPADLIVIHDITRQKETERNLRESKKFLEDLNESKDRFFSLISHDLRTPFNAIIGFSELLWKEEMPPGDVKRIAGDLYKTGKESYELLNNLLEWSRSEAGRSGFSPTNFRLSTMVERTVAHMGETATWKDIGILVNIEEDLRLFADENMFMTMIRNLVSNAIKYTPRGGRIEIHASCKGDNIEISVEDNGVGIRPELLPELFSLKKEKRNKGTEGEPGTGLGLILCKEFAEKHNGRIFVESTEGIGSTFTLELPKAR